MGGEERGGWRVERGGGEEGGREGRIMEGRIGEGRGETGETGGRREDNSGGGGNRGGEGKGRRLRKKGVLERKVIG
jgi:hypothetical protein